MTPAALGSSRVYLACSAPLTCLSFKDRLQSDKPVRQVERIIVTNSLMRMEKLAVEIDGESTPPSVVMGTDSIGEETRSRGLEMI